MLYRILLFSVKHQHESAIDIHMSPLLELPAHLPPLNNPKFFIITKASVIQLLPVSLFWPMLTCCGHTAFYFNISLFFPLEYAFPFFLMASSFDYYFSHHPIWCCFEISSLPALSITWLSYFFSSAVINTWNYHIGLFKCSFTFTLLEHKFCEEKDFVSFINYFIYSSHNRT